MTGYIIVTAAAFFVGMLNTVAGGGTFLTFPALLFTGVSPVVANATSAVAVFPGYFGGALGFRKEIAAFDRFRLVKIIILTAVGGLSGSLLLLISSNEIFTLVVPFLLTLATIVFAFGSQIGTWAGRRSSGKNDGAFGTLMVSVYGGYFNGGLGIVLLALFSSWGMRDLNAMNGLKSALSFLLSSISVATFAVAGIVAWPQAILMMLAATIGGYVGAPIARALPAVAVKVIVISVGATMSIVFFWRAFA
jgi:uncharacterized protein